MSTTAAPVRPAAAQSHASLRDYLNQSLAPHLKRALTASLDVDCEYPLQYLGEYLINSSLKYENNPDSTDIKERFLYTFDEPPPPQPQPLPTAASDSNSTNGHVLEETAHSQLNGSPNPDPDTRLVDAPAENVAHMVEMAETDQPISHAGGGMLDGISEIAAAPEDTEMKDSA